jgi:transcriptional regulator with XRE-family HTH domain
MGLRLGMTSGQEATEARVDEELSQLVTQLMNEINWHMHERNLTRADLASRMGVSAGRVSQVLSGGENLTLRTLASLAAALDARFELELRPLAPAAGATSPGHSARTAAPAPPAEQPPPDTVSFGPATPRVFSRRR